MVQQLIRALLVDDDPDIRAALPERLAMTLETELPNVEVTFQVTAQLTEALKTLSSAQYDLVVSDLKLSDGQNDIIEAVREMRQKVATRNLKVIVFSGMSLDVTTRRSMLNEFRVQAIVAKPDTDRLSEAVMTAVRGILDQRSTSTGLPGSTQAQHTLVDLVLPSLSVPTVCVGADLRKIGLALNNILGRAAGNAAINLFAKIAKNWLWDKYPSWPDLDKTLFQDGGDEFLFIFRTDERKTREQLTELVLSYCRDVGGEFDRRINEVYPEPYSRLPVLVGEDVRDHFGNCVVIPKPSARFAIMPMYRDAYSDPADLNRVENQLHARMKSVDKKLEDKASRVFGFPAKKWPRLKEGDLAKKTAEAAKILANAKSQYLVATYTETQQWLKWKGRRKQSGNLE